MLLLPKCPFFSQAQWFAAWLGAFASESVEAEVDGISIPFIPRRQRRWGLAHRFLSAPANEHSPCLRLPCLPSRETAGLDAALRRLYRRQAFSWLEFPLLEHDAPELVSLRALVGCGWHLVEARHPHTAIAEFEDGWEAYHRALSKKLRANTNRAENGLSRLGELRFEDAAESAMWIEAWEEFLALEAQGWKGETQSAIAGDEKLVAFYRRVLEEAHRQGKLRLYLLRLDGRLIGANLVIVEGATAYGWKTAYAPDLAKYSPGNVLQRKVTQALAEEGVGRLDMLDPVTDWKRRWATRVEPRIHLRLFPPGLRGGIFYRLVHMRNTGSGDGSAG